MQRSYVLTKKTVLVNIVLMVLIIVVAACVSAPLAPEAPPEKVIKVKTAVPAAKQPLASFTEQTTGMQFVFVKGGCYAMGDNFGDDEPGENPMHDACVGDFFIGRYEVTQSQWTAVMGSNPSHFNRCGKNCPVDDVAWEDAQAFIKKLNSLLGSKIYRLPTEAEWEYAARSGGKKERYSGGNDKDSVAWSGGNSFDHTHPVGQKRPNGLGIYDMSGNVWEWVALGYDKNLNLLVPRNNRGGNGSGIQTSLRGGSWNSSSKYVCASNRTGVLPSPRGSYGLRLARSAQ
jgi:formylglycine-generating enzyme